MWGCDCDVAACWEDVAPPQHGKSHLRHLRCRPSPPASTTVNRGQRPCLQDQLTQHPGHEGRQHGPHAGCKVGSGRRARTGYSCLALHVMKLASTLLHSPPPFHLLDDAAALTTASLHI